jgi:hypothetical protein
MLPFECSRPDFMSLQLDSMQVATPRLACMMRRACMRELHASWAAHCSSP